MKMVEAREGLLHLIEKYIPNEADRMELIAYVEREDVPVKGIIADMTEKMVGRMDREEALTWKNIIYHYA